MVLRRLGHENQVRLQHEQRIDKVPVPTAAPCPAAYFPALLPLKME
jgi:hypothetical protein